MFDPFQILATLCSLAVGATLIIVPILALVLLLQTRQRLGILEREVARLRQKVAAAPVEVVEAIPVEEVGAVSEKRIEPKRRLRPVLPIAAAAPDWSKLEAWLGVRALGWAAVVLLVFAGAYFLKI